MAGPRRVLSHPVRDGDEEALTAVLAELLGANAAAWRLLVAVHAATTPTAAIADLSSRRRRGRSR
jgi:hypothetical protein